MGKTYLRKWGVASRYATTPRTVDRMKADGRLPQPDLYSGRSPLWSEDRLDANDRAAAMRSRPKRTEREGA
jgi:hypothetical protein